MDTDHRPTPKTTPLVRFSFSLPQVSLYLRKGAGAVSVELIEMSTMARSLYQKACPNCAALQPVANDVCECGYSFDSTTAVASNQALTQDEELFIVYLGARVDQARGALENARLALAARPGDFAKAVAVMEAVHELRVAREDLDSELARHPQGSALLETRAAAQSAQPSDEFRAQQAARAAKIVESLQDAARRAPPPFHTGATTDGLRPEIEPHRG
jgi:hypothetical protein